MIKSFIFNRKYSKVRKSASEKYKFRKSVHDKYSYKVEDSASYRRLKHILLADQSNIHRAVLAEKDLRDFENQADPNYKGVIRSKPLVQYKVQRVG